MTNLWDTAASDNTGDQSAAIASALATAASSDGVLDLGHDGRVYRITSAISYTMTRALRIVGRGKINVAFATAQATAVKFVTTGYYLECSMQVDCNNLARVGLHFQNQAANMSSVQDLVLDTRVTGVKSVTGNTGSVIGTYVEGGFGHVSGRVMVDGAGRGNGINDSVQGAVLGQYNSTSWARSSDVWYDVRNVTADATFVKQDCDGVFVQLPSQTNPGSSGELHIIRGRVENAWGRFVKTQAVNSMVTEFTGVLTSAWSDNIQLVGIDHQYGGKIGHDVRLIYTDTGYVVALNCALRDGGEPCITGNLTVVKTGSVTATDAINIYSLGTGYAPFPAWIRNVRLIGEVGNAVKMFTDTAYSDSSRPIMYLENITANNLTTSLVALSGSAVNTAVVARDCVNTGTSRPLITTAGPVAVAKQSNCLGLTSSGVSSLSWDDSSWRF